MCNQCDKDFPDSFLLKYHSCEPVDRNQKETDQTRYISCPFCDLQFENLDILKKHIQNAHTDHEDEGCIKCNFIGSNNNIEEHMKSKHGRTWEPFPCEACGLAVANPDLL